MGGKCCKKYFCCCCQFCGCCCNGNKISGITPEDLEWMLNHTPYEEKEIKLIFTGFRLEFPLGGISRREFERMFTTKNAKQMCEVVFNTLDADDSGYLDLREFLLAIELVAARTPEEKLIWAFRQYDRDNSGQLDQAEMSKAMKSIYYMLNSIGDAPKNNPEEKAENIFRQIDLNSDGFLTMEEFLRGCMNDAELMLLLEKLFNFLTEGMD